MKNSLVRKINTFIIKSTFLSICNPKNIFSLIVLSFLISSCKNTDKQDSHINTEFSEESLIKVNKEIVKDESEAIQAYIKRHKLEVLETGTGLRYMNYFKGKGEKAASGKVALVKYKISLLDGTVCYSSDKKGVEEFLIGKDQVESGLHEGVELMRVGDKNIFILPPHLAHGLIGDLDKIPPLSTVVYDIELVGLQ